jgi:hypothetical protein
MRRLTFLAIVFSLSAQGTLEQRAIRIARAVPASHLEPGLPNQPLEKWLAAALPGAAIKWEANDCGEQSGDPATDRARDIPMCVDAIASFAGGRLAIVTIAMGSFHKGIARTPKLGWVNLGPPDRLTPIPRLGGLPAAVRRDN